MFIQSNIYGSPLTSARRVTVRRGFSDSFVWSRHLPRDTMLMVCATPGPLDAPENIPTGAHTAKPSGCVTPRGFMHDSTGFRA